MRRRIEVTLPPWLDQVLDAGPVLATMLDRMDFAIGLAERNVVAGTGGPFGAAVIEGESGRVVAAGVNVVVPSGNCTAHAEMVAIELAERARASYDLGDPAQPALELVTSVEPCAMCLGAVVWSGVGRLVCGATSSAAARIGFDEGPRPRDWVAQLTCRGIGVERGVRADVAERVLQRYVGEGGAIYNASR